MQKVFLWIVVGLAFLVAVATRTLFLTQIPTSFSHDEMGYLINAKSVAVSGVGRYGEWQPFSLKPVEASLAELPTIMLAGFFKLPFSEMVSGRLLSVLMSLTLPFFIASISYSLFKSKTAAFFTWIMALFNPWIWQNGRLVFDIPISLWFYVLGTAIFLHFKSWHRLFSLIPFFIGFYSYQGFKLTLPFICVALSVYVVFAENLKISVKKIWPSLVLTTCAVGLFGYYLLFQFGQQSASQARIANQIITPKSETISTAVNTDRRLALLTPINNLFVNKYTQTAKEIIGRYLLVFGPRELFYEISASNSPFAVWNHGPFYLIDALLIVLGVFAITSQKQHKQFALLAALAILSVLPAVLNQSIWLYFRPSYLFPILLIFGGLGFELLWQGRRWVFASVAALYVMAIMNFGFLYFVRYPVYASESIYFGPRLLAEYLNRVPSTQKIVVFEKEPEFVFTSFIFYFDRFTPETAAEIHAAYKNKIYAYGNIVFADCLPVNFEPALDTTYVVDSDVPDCPTPTNAKKIKTTAEVFAPLTKISEPIFVRSVKDNGVNYSILGQTLCANPTTMEHFINPQSLRLFAVSAIATDEFCQNWLTTDLPLE